MESPPPADETTSPPLAPQPPEGRCPNCGTSLLGPWCHHCGQEARDPLGEFGTALHTLLDDTLHFDNRVWRTLVPLFLRPGFLTAEYFRGHRVRYVAPFKLMFFLAVVAFFLVRITVSVTGPPPGVNGLDLVHFASAKTPQAVRRVRAREIRTVTRQLDQASLAREVRKRDLASARATIDYFARHRLAQLAQGRTGVGIAGVSAPFLAGLDHPREWIDATLRLLPIAMLVLLPLFALLLKLFMPRRSYVEHLIVALHSHAFVFLDLIVLVCLSTLASWTANLPLLPVIFSGLAMPAGLWLFIYPGLMQKRVYGQRPIRAVAAYTLIGILYGLLLLAVVLGVLAVSLWHGF